MVITIVIVPILRSSTENFPTVIPPVEPSKTRIFGAPVSKSTQSGLHAVCTCVNEEGERKSGRYSLKLVWNLPLITNLARTFYSRIYILHRVRPGTYSFLLY